MISTQVFASGVRVDDKAHQSKLLRLSRLATFALLFWALCSCTRGIATTQELDIVSGQFAIPSKGRVISIDLIRFGNYLPRYNEAARTAATLWLRNEGAEDRDLGDLLEGLVGEVAYQIVDEVEQNIRRSNCIYIVAVDSAVFQEQLVNTFETGGSTTNKDLQLEEILRDLDRRDLDTLNAMSDEDYEAELDRLYQEEYAGRQLTGTIEEIGIASQCLIGLNVGDETNLFFFGDRIALSPNSFGETVSAE